MRYYLVAGEASGDLHGSNLIKGLKVADPNAEFRCWGGDLMEAEGAKLVKHYKDSAIIGFVEVLMSLKRLLGNLKMCKKDILEYKPDALILIDYPGFNFRIAEFAKNNGIRVFYYIAPKVWAWKEKRVHRLKKFVDRLFIIFPFEIEYFKKWGINAIYNGNPLLDSVDNFKYSHESRDEFDRRCSLIPKKPVIALLAGSRKGEIGYLLPRMAKLIDHYPQYQFVLAGAPATETTIYKNILDKFNIKLVTENETPDGNKREIKLLKGETYSILKHAEAAIISSGTASLEAALIGTPQVVCYGGNEISYRIAKCFVKLKYISLANLIMDAGLFKELIQHDCTPTLIKKELDRLLSDTPYREKMIEEYTNVRRVLGGKGASERVANSMVAELEAMIKADKLK
ncbi:MAG: lipid-A-disaccharide synthase [Bacteroidales bacterium]|nr:lipid-A-disaccharide synthase [Bacteroidales bacterium]